MARVGLAAPANVVDLGCGAGNVTRILAERWPVARITGLDNSDAMLARARSAASGNIAWQSADLAAWAADAPPASVDLVYSNAALHWLDDHATLFPRLLGIVARGGSPCRCRRISRTVARRVACRGGQPAGARNWERCCGQSQWRPPPCISKWPRRTPTRRMDDRIPARASTRQDGDHPIIGWMKGSALTPYLAVLDAAAQREFVRDCAERVAAAYPPRTDGRVLYSFRRVFIVAAVGNR
jgi:trans-aconitate 2-methyltransferase